MDFLEADWDVCVKQSQHDETEQEAMLQQSLIWQYIFGESQSVTRTVRRRIVKAVFAIASADSIRDYPEIWERETKESPERANKRQKIGNVDFETGEMADYDSDEETRNTLRVTRATERNFEDSPLLSLPDIKDGCLNLQDAIERLGGSEAIMLRQRLLALVGFALIVALPTLLTGFQLAQVAIKLPTHFTTLHDWFDNVVEDFRYLPTILFSVFLTSLTMPGPMKVMFLANLLLPLVNGTLPDYFRYDPTQEHFESILLPLHGKKQAFADNAKVSLILEQLFLLMVTDYSLKPTNEIKKAMELGIATRHSVHGTARGKKSNAGEEKQAKDLMEASSGRMLGMLEMLEIAAGKPTQKKADQENSAASSSISGSLLSSAPSDMEGD